MALTIANEIIGQEATTVATYCYLYEPLRVQITESVSTAKKISILLEVLDTSNTSTVVDTVVDYAVYDINPGQPLSIDLMKLAQQYHDANVYNFSNLNEIIYGSTSWQSVVSKYIYVFKIQSDETSTPTIIKKLPIIGGRTFSNFKAKVGSDTILSEDIYTPSTGTYASDVYWNGYSHLRTTLDDLSSGTDFSPTTQKIEFGTNLIFNDTLTDTSKYTLYSGTITGGQSDPIGGSNAYVISDSSQAVSLISNSILSQDPDGKMVTYSIWIKGEGEFGLFVQGIQSSDNYLSITQDSATSNWKKYTYTFKKPSDASDVGIQIFKYPDGEDLFVYQPILKVAVDTKADGGKLVWKSRHGGWMSWGFKLKKESQAKKYEGNIQVGMFESTLPTNGSPYIPVNYTGISTSYSINLKELGLTTDELSIVQSIIASPAVYYMRDQGEELELMRLTSANAPLDNKANGGDFTVSLSSISTTMQKTR